ncbi:MAG: hypothetical protein NUW37_06750 [Planctomycetes bacterium]|nr:hypothetical protein [Planctomycetota bacterium]
MSEVQAIGCKSSVIDLMEKAKEHAAILSRGDVRELHVMLALINDPESHASRILADDGIDIHRLQKRIVQELREE